MLMTRISRLLNFCILQHKISVYFGAEALSGMPLELKSARTLRRRPPPKPSPHGLVGGVYSLVLLGRSRKFPSIAESPRRIEFGTGGCVEMHELHSVAGPVLSASWWIPSWSSLRSAASLWHRCSMAGPYAQERFVARRCLVGSIIGRSLGSSSWHQQRPVDMQSGCSQIAGRKLGYKPLGILRTWWWTAVRRVVCRELVPDIFMRSGLSAFWREVKQQQQQLARKLRKVCLFLDRSQWHEVRWWRRLTRAGATLMEIIAPVISWSFLLV